MTIGWNVEDNSNEQDKIIDVHVHMMNPSDDLLPLLEMAIERLSKRDVQRFSGSSVNFHKMKVERTSTPLIEDNQRYGNKLIAILLHDFHAIVAQELEAHIDAVCQLYRIGDNDAE